MHTSTIWNMGVDAQGRYLVTGSYDKTVRVWSLPEGKLLRVLRPPIGVGEEGKIFAVAISPDGRLVACGGWTGYQWDRSNSLYLFDRASGTLVRRITGLPNVVDDICFSRDGRLLAAGVGGREGVGVFRAATGELVMTDTDYDDSIYSVDFDATGRLVVSALDGYIRLYGVGLKRVAKVKAPGGMNPLSARFSPDGSRVAVGYGDTPRVSVLSGKTLSPLYEPTTTDLKRTSLARVCWSSDGSTLYAAGHAEDSEGRTIVRRWRQRGKGAPTDIPVAKDTIMDLRLISARSTSKTSGIVFASASPRFGILPQGADVPRVLQNSPVSDYRGAGATIRLDASAATVQFGYLSGEDALARLSVPSRSLLMKVGDNDSSFEMGDRTRPPRLEAEGLNITGWRQTTPLLNGVPLPLESNEISRSLAIAPDRQSFLLGTSQRLRCYGRDGNLRWSMIGPGNCWAVNVAEGNGSVGVAAFHDGTIHWYRMKDGKELLAFFPHAETKRWVLWTPSGYYDCSPGGEDLIGWHHNKGKDAAAEFRPASRLRDVYHRPDVIKHILTTLDEAEALRLANEEKGKPNGSVAPPSKPQ